MATSPQDPPKLRSVLIFFTLAAALAVAIAVGLTVYYALTWEDPSGGARFELLDD